MHIQLIIQPAGMQPYLHIVKDVILRHYISTAFYLLFRNYCKWKDLISTEIDKIFPPQISSAFITQLSETLNLPREKFIDVVGEGPDLFSSSLPYALEHAYENGACQNRVILD